MSNKEARSEKLHRSFDLIEDEFIDEAAPHNATPLLHLKNKQIKQLTAIAACFCIFFGAVASIFIYKLGSPKYVIIPTYDDAQYSALDIARFLSEPQKEGVATNAYTKRYVPSDEYLYIDPIPSEEYLTVYEKAETKQDLDVNEFAKFSDGIISRLFKKINMPVPTYEIELDEDPKYPEDNNLSAKFSKDMGIFLYLRQHLNYSWFSIHSNSLSNNRPPLLFDGIQIEIDQRKSDEEIKRDLEPIKEKLFYIFGADFADVKIVRTYSDNSENGVSTLEIFFYNSNAHPLNADSFQPISDYIWISFENYMNFSGDIVSDSVLTQYTVSYRQYRSTPEERFVPKMKLKMIPLKDAEALLYNGYVFGGHACPLCMAAQDGVDFENYDYVDLQYVFGYDDGTEVLPFYAFYKYIGKSANGNKTYAKTYVPAIEVTGYEEYFESQKSQHK